MNCNLNRCTKLQNPRYKFTRCLLDKGHTGRHNYQTHRKDEMLLARFMNNRSVRGMM